MNSAARDLEADSVKGALIWLVVLGHIVDIFSYDMPAYRALDAAITLFHMPLFIFIVGMYSRSALGEQDYRAMFGRLILPLIFFQAAYLVPLWLVTGKLLAAPTAPYFHLWFLLAIVLMKLALGFAARLPFAIGAAVALTLLAGYDAQIGFSFSLSRTLYFFPFFLAGHLYGRRLFALARARQLRFGALFVLSVGGVAAWSLAGLPHNALAGAAAYADKAVLADAPALGRAFALCLSCAAALGFVALVPVSKALAYLGRRSLVIYLCHGYVILALSRVVAEMGEQTALWLLPAWLLLALLLCYALAPLNARFTAAFESAGERILSGRRRPVTPVLKT